MAVTQYQANINRAVEQIAGMSDRNFFYMNWTDSEAQKQEIYDILRRFVQWQYVGQGVQYRAENDQILFCAIVNVFATLQDMAAHLNREQHYTLTRKLAGSLVMMVGFMVG